jgi:hypothetical protein
MSPIITGYVPCNLIPRAYPRIPTAYPCKYVPPNHKKNHKSLNTNCLPLKKTSKFPEKFREKEGEEGKKRKNSRRKKNKRKKLKKPKKFSTPLIPATYP